MSKRINIDVSDKFHTDIKTRATKEGKTIKQYLIEIIAKHMMDTK